MFSETILLEGYFYKNTVQHLFLEKVHKCCSIGDERKTSCERFVAFPSSNIKYKDKSAGAALEITFYWLFISSQDKITSSKQIYHSTGPVLLLQQMKIFFCKKKHKITFGWLVGNRCQGGGGQTSVPQWSSLNVNLGLNLSMLGFFLATFK